MIQGHGNNRYDYGEKIIIDFSSNIAFNNRSSAIVEYLKGELREIENYPDPTAHRLACKIAEHHGVTQGCIAVCNGSAEGFYMVAHYLVRRGEHIPRSLIFTPSFAEYEDSCRLYGHNVEFAALSDFTDIDFSKVDSVWIGTPNNPDGKRVCAEDIERVARENPHCIFVVDRAYNTLSASCDCDSIITSSNIILIHSLTKPFGIPGLRLGYIVAQEEHIEHLSTLRPPWSVNALSLVAGEYVMDNYNSLQVDVEELLAESTYLQAELSQIDGLEIIPSDSNFFVCRIEDGRKASDMQEYLINRYGILVRDASNFRGLTQSHFRIAAQCRGANIKLIEALLQWI